MVSHISTLLKVMAYTLFLISSLINLSPNIVSISENITDDNDNEIINMNINIVIYLPTYLIRKIINLSSNSNSAKLVVVPLNLAVNDMFL